MEKEMAPHSSILACEIHGQRSLAIVHGGHKKFRQDLVAKEQQYFQRQI